MQNTIKRAFVLLFFVLFKILSYLRVYIYLHRVYKLTTIKYGSYQSKRILRVASMNISSFSLYAIKPSCFFMNRFHLFTSCNSLCWGHRKWWKWMEYLVFSPVLPSKKEPRISFHKTCIKASYVWKMLVPGHSDWNEKIITNQNEILMSVWAREQQLVSQVLVPGITQVPSV